MGTLRTHSQGDQSIPISPQIVQQGPKVAQGIP